MSEKFPVIRVEWTERERGWGQRPDGFSLHLTKADAEAFKKDWAANQPKLSQAPDEYSSPDNGYDVFEINAENYQALKETKNGARFFREKDLELFVPMTEYEVRDRQSTTFVKIKAPSQEQAIKNMVETVIVWMRESPGLYIEVKGN